MGNKSISQVRADFSLKSILNRLLLPCIEDLKRQLACLTTDCSVNQIHQSRILVRKVRANLDTFESLLRKDLTIGMRDELKWLDSFLAPLRDIDVTLELLTHTLCNANPAHKIAADAFEIRLINRLRKQRNVNVLALQEQLQNSRAHQLNAELSKLVTEIPIRKGLLSLSAIKQLAEVHHCLTTSQDKLLRFAQESIANPSIRILHRVRIQAKRLHYPYSAMQEADLVPASSTVKLATRLHKLLGMHQDLATLEVWLKRQDTVLVSESAVKSQWLSEIKERRNELKNTYLYIVQSARIT
jgi:CHAD domain-containing protein